MPELLFYRHSREIMRVRVDGRDGVTTIGRGPKNDVVIPEPTVSRRHCSVEKAGEKWVLRDLSGKGTEVAGKPVQEIELRDGADVSLGFVRMQFNAETRTDDNGASAEITTAECRTGGTLGESRAPERLTGAVRLHVAGRKGEHSFAFSGEAVIGTGAQCSVRVEDSSVSSQHVRIEKRGSEYVFTDLKSKNGVWLGDVRIFEAAVPPGCAVRIGTTELTLRSLEDGQAPYQGIVGQAPAMRKLYEAIERVAPSDAIVLISGESGTGKDLVARAIHARSNRAAGPFVPVNCSALSQELIESELFGHEKGSFTGASRQHPGAFVAADGGTLFFDEIGELPLAAQAKLLRAVETGEIKPVGSSVPFHVNVRIIAATNADLRAEVRRNRFREDLYWRLNVVRVSLPSLRDRKNDLGELVGHFLKMYAPKGETVALTSEAETLLRDHHWPGNVRELKNAIHRSLVLRKGAQIEAEDIAFDQEADLELSPSAASVGNLPNDPLGEDLERVFIRGKTLEALEGEILIKTFRRFSSNIARMAKELGRSRTTIYEKLERLGLGREKCPD